MCNANRIHDDVTNTMERRNAEAKRTRASRTRAKRRNTHEHKTGSRWKEGKSGIKIDDTPGFPFYFVDCFIS